MAVAGSETQSNPVSRNPYVGPRPFETGEALFGRDRELSELHYLLSAERIVLLYSPSGAGKSSLVQAGLIPRLRERFDVWRPTRVSLEPPELAVGSDSPNGGVNRYVLSLLQGIEEGIPEHLRHGADKLASMTLAEYARTRPRRPGAPDNVVIVVDQFEEILTVDPLAVAAKHELFDQLGDLLRQPRIWALFVLREDYLAPLDPYARRVPTHLRNRFRIDLLSREAAQEAVVRPAQVAGRRFTAAEDLVDDLAKTKVQQADGSLVEQPGHHVEPVQLQVVCRRLWEALPDDDVTIDGQNLQLFGNVTEALAYYYADSVARVADGNKARERAIREWFGHRLITAGGLRSQVLRGDGQGLGDKIVLQLLDTHLIRGEDRAGATWYELAHDRLIEPVRAENDAWRERHLSGIQKRAALWDQQGRPPGLLYADTDLELAEYWAERAAVITDVEQGFLDASCEARAVAERTHRHTRRIRHLAFIASIVSIVAIAAGVYAGWQWREANAQRAAAERARDEARDRQRQAEEEKRAAEEARLEAEEQRELAEQRRKEAEEAHQGAERQRRLFEELLDLRNLILGPDYQPRTLHEIYVAYALGLAYRDMRDDVKAMELFLQGLNALEMLAVRFNEEEDFNLTFRSQFRSLYHDALVTFLNQRREDEAHDILERLRTRGHSPLPTKEIRKALDPGTLMLSYSVGSQRTYLFVLSHEAELAVHEISVSEETLVQKIERFSSKLRQPTSEGGSAAEDRWLYDALLAPAAQRIGRSERLFIVADGPLHHVPFAALRRPNGKYVVEWKPVHSAVSVTVYATLQEGRGQASTNPEGLDVRSAMEHAVYEGFEILPNGRTIVASLWEIEDSKTAKFMSRFQRHLRDDKTKDEALRATQIGYLQDPSAPCHWAAFRIIGDWK